MTKQFHLAWFTNFTAGAWDATFSHGGSSWDGKFYVEFAQALERGGIVLGMGLLQPRRVGAADRGGVLRRVYPQFSPDVQGDAGRARRGRDRRTIKAAPAPPPTLSRGTT